MGLGGNGGREELARENLELKASDRKYAFLSAVGERRVAAALYLV